jgi:hypothetical protein
MMAREIEHKKAKKQKEHLPTSIFDHIKNMDRKDQIVPSIVPF